MSGNIPEFDHNLVLPPHLGNPTSPKDLSPYPCTTEDLCRRFGNTVERNTILTQFLDFRERLHELGLDRGFQWLDGSFLEDVETREGRSPRDLDVVTVYWGYPQEFQETLYSALPEFADPSLAKQSYRLDHYPFDASHSPQATVEGARYWIGLFSHNRNGVWKGMLKIDLSTTESDSIARQILATAQL